MSKLSNGNARRDAPPPAGEEDGASWFIRTRGMMSEGEQRDFILWLAADPSNARDYDAVSAAWNACLDHYADNDLFAMRLKAIAAVSGARHCSGEGE